MIDIHCHILPNMDDGAKSSKEAMAMADASADSGVSGIIATPHFDYKALADAGFHGRMNEQLAILRGELGQETTSPEIYSGGEILLSNELLENLTPGALPTLADSDYLLTEFWFDEDPQAMNRMLEQISDMGYRPVIAHPERYFAVQEDLHMAVEWFKKGYVLQINKDSVTGKLGRNAHNTVRWILERGLAHIAASDAHGAIERTADLDGIYELLELEYDAEYAEILLNENPGRIVENRPMADAG